MNFVLFSRAQSDDDTILVGDDFFEQIADSTYVEKEDHKPVIENIAPIFRIPSEKKIEEFQNDKRFQYETPQPKTLSWLDKLKYKIIDFFLELFSGVARSGAASFIVILAVIAIVVFIIFKLTGIKFRSIFGKQKLDTPPIDIYSENVHEMDFDTLIANALKNKDYRLVVRFMYLKNLKKLTDNGVIAWNINKTNYSYQFEIKDITLRDKFLDTTFIFDYVWYGEFPIDEMNFSRAYDELNQFNQMIGK